MRYWVHGVDKENKRESLRLLKDSGFDTIVIGVDEETIDMAKEFDIDVCICSGTYSASGIFVDESRLSVDVNGKRQPWFNSTCPNRREVREKNIADIFSPMIYRNYRADRGPACLNHELVCLAKKFIGISEKNCLWRV